MKIINMLYRAGIGKNKNLSRGRSMEMNSRASVIPMISPYKSKDIAATDLGTKVHQNVIENYIDEEFIKLMGSKEELPVIKKVKKINISFIALKNKFDENFLFFNKKKIFKYNESFIKTIQEITTSSRKFVFYIESIKLNAISFKDVGLSRLFFSIKEPTKNLLFNTSIAENDAELEV